MRRPDISEALRCLGAARSGPELRQQAEQLADELSAALQPRSVRGQSLLGHSPQARSRRGSLRAGLLFHARSPPLDNTNLHDFT